VTVTTTQLDKSGKHYYIQSMTNAAILLREIETMPEAAAAEVLDFAMFIKSRHTPVQPHNGIAIKDAYGIFKELKGMDTTIERDEEDRI
jgi:hypothetical protein